MVELSFFFHYLTIVMVTVLNATGVAIAQGLSNRACLQAMDRQPQARNELARIAVLGAALIETAAVFGALMSIFLFATGPGCLDQNSYLSYLGIMVALALPGLTIGLVSAWPVREACFALARQPFFAAKINRFLLITLSIIQTPLILSFIVALFIRAQINSVSTFSEHLRLFSSGLAIGIGSIGSAIGLAYYAKNACRGLGINRSAYNALLTFSLISQAIIETPIILSMIVSIISLFSRAPEPIHGIIYLAAALSVALGVLSPGFNSGRTAAAAALQIAFHPMQARLLTRTSILAQTLIDTGAIYALIIAILLIFLV